MSDIRKIAALAMLSPDGKEAERLEGDVAEILQRGQTMPARCASAETRTVTTDALRDDAVSTRADSAELLALSQKARDGYIVVSRTVGGES